MASNGTQEKFSPSDVLAAVRTMRTGEKETKTKAHEYLERFQKSVCVDALNTHEHIAVRHANRGLIEGFMGHHNGNPPIHSRARGHPVCRYNTSWKGFYSASQAQVPTTLDVKLLT